MSWYAASWTACGGDRPRPLLLEAHGAGGAPSAEAEDRGNSHCKFATSTSRFLEGRLLGQSRKRVKLDGETPSASSDSEHDILEPPEIEPRVLKQMEEIVQKSGDRRWAVRKILRLGVLDGQRVEYRKLGKSVLTGTMMANGKVQCDCSCCQGTEVVTCLSFEEHAKGYMRRPADNIFIVSLNQSIREFCFQGIDNATTSERAAACTGRSAIRRFIQENKSQKVLPMKRRETDVSQQTVLLDLSEQGNDSTQSSQLSASSMPDHQNLPRFPYIHSRQQHHMSSGYQNQQRPSPNQQHWTDVPGSSTLLPSIQYSRADSLLHDSDFFSLQNKSAHQQHFDPLATDYLLRHEDHSSALHRRLFTPGPSCLLMDGEPVSYISAQGDYLLSGTVMLNPQGVSGIICGCCSNVVDCPTFQCHAGVGADQAPYCNIFTSGGDSLLALAMYFPDCGTLGGSVGLSSEQFRNPLGPSSPPWRTEFLGSSSFGIGMGKDELHRTVLLPPASSCRQLLSSMETQMNPNPGQAWGCSGGDHSLGLDAVLSDYVSFHNKYKSTDPRTRSVTGLFRGDSQLP